MTLPPPGPAEEPEGGPRRRSLRQRLLLALAGISAGSVLLAGLITVALARQATRSAAQDDLRRGLAQVAEADAAGEQIPPLARIQRVMQASGIGLVLVTEVGGVVPPATGPLGRRLPGPPFDRRNTDLDRLREAAVPGARGRLPRGVTSGDLDLGRLLAGQVQEGSSGSLVFVAQPLSPKNSGVPVVVATRRVGIFPVQRLGTVLLLAALASAAVAAGFSVWLVRRLTRPLAAMERTARRIAGGDLQARVEGMAGADDELARLGEAIDSMAAELERAQGLERGFLMSVSHDLRTPLTSIRGYAEAIAEGAADDDEARRRAATIIGAEARRLERLVADLLDLARLDAREF
jgi:two-component system OmpR family sensor kinase